jgi:FAD-linked oxidoreductase
MDDTWSNWSGSVRMRPRERLRPRDQQSLAAAVARASHVRVVGAGHSFMPLCETEGTLLDLSELEGQLKVAPDGRSVWAPAGWSLRKLAPRLWEMGLSLPNQGDIDTQSLAGAIATGTHGTGAALGSLSTLARAFRLLLADGSVVECSDSELPELFHAQRLSLGLLGIALAIRVDVLPAYRLEERVSVVSLAQMVEHFDEVAAQHRHAEFFVFPYADQVILKTLQPTDDARHYEAPSPFDAPIFKLACEATAAFPAAARKVQGALMRLVRGSRRFGPAHMIFPNERSVRFEEMEYELPRSAGLPALREVLQWIRARSLPVAFPFEFRWTAADDIWLSPFNGVAAASVSMHQYAKMPWSELFASAEAIFRAHGGRPHWAKRHTLSARQVSELYPDAAKFRAVRDQVDPQAKFANPHLMELFAIERAR